MPAFQFKKKITFLVLGFILLILQSLDNYDLLFSSWDLKDIDPSEDRERRNGNRERRSRERALNSLSQKPSIRKFIKITEDKTNNNWANERIQLSEAMKNFKGRRQILIAVIDTGVDLNNPLIKESIYKNSGEFGLDKNGNDKRYNNIDDDMNGFIDDFQGWNFSGNNNKPQDHHGHGTHISGIILNGLEKTKNIKILPLQFFSESTTSKQNIINTAQAIKYAVKMGADIINYSAGGGRPNDIEKAAINLAEENDVLLIAAAGNESSNNDRSPYYPANYHNKNIISVASIDKKDRKVSSSNYGLDSIDLFAPGHSIQSIGLNNTRIKLTGTSQATAFVTKVAALTLSASINKIDPIVLREHLILKATTSPGLKSYSRGAGVVNANRSLSTLSQLKTNEKVQIRELEKSKLQASGI